MSEKGQKAKYSPGANVFRFAPRNGHRATTAACPVGATSGLKSGVWMWPTEQGQLLRFTASYSTRSRNRHSLTEECFCKERPLLGCTAAQARAANPLHLHPSCVPNAIECRSLAQKSGLEAFHPSKIICLPVTCCRR